jgi:hypothetical protein
MRRPLLLPAFVFACLCVTTFTSVAGPTPPTNQLYGFISSNRTLTYAYPGPDYDVLGDLVIMPGVTLTIEPGVTLRMATTDILQGGDNPSGVELDVQGTLIADGSAGDSIRIVSTAANPLGGEWGDINVRNGGRCVLRRAVIGGPLWAVVSSGILEAQAPELAGAYRQWFDLEVSARAEGWALLSGIRR